MNQKELNEIRRRFRLDKSNISHIYGCYVNSNKEIISYVDASLGLMQQEEKEMYLTLLKKSISGALGKNLLDVVFSTQQVADSDEHRLLQTLRSTALKDLNARESLYKRIIDAMDMGEQNYLILLAADAYDVPYRAKDGEEFRDAQDQVFQYFVCSICPVKSPSMALRFFHEENEFHSSSTGNVVAPPELGFMFPAFDDRTANIYNALFYTKAPAELHQEVIDAVFHIDEPPMSAVEQKNIFDAALTTSLEEDCSYDVVQSVHEQIRARIEDHKESGDPEPLSLSLSDVGDILQHSGVSQDKAGAFRTECERQYGADATLDPKNIIDSRKFEVTTSEVKITVAPENSFLLETRIIDGQKYLLIPVDSTLEVNGIGVTVPGLTDGEAEEDTAE